MNAPHAVLVSQTGAKIDFARVHAALIELRRRGAISGSCYHPTADNRLVIRCVMAPEDLRGEDDYGTWVNAQLSYLAETSCCGQMLRWVSMPNSSLVLLQVFQNLSSAANNPAADRAGSLLSSLESEHQIAGSVVERPFCPTNALSVSMFLPVDFQWSEDTGGIAAALSARSREIAGRLLADYNGQKGIAALQPFVGEGSHIVVHCASECSEPRLAALLEQVDYPLFAALTHSSKGRQELLITAFLPFPEHQQDEDSGGWMTRVSETRRAFERLILETMAPKNPLFFGGQHRYLTELQA